ncbi:MAG: helix-turn-helix transcriptional regulator [Sphingobium sp.]
MNGVTLREAFPRAGSAENTARMISSIGSESFMDVLLSEIYSICGAEYCSVFQLSDAKLMDRGSASLDHSAVSREQARLYVAGEFWKRDPAIYEAQERSGHDGSSLVRMRIGDINDTDLRDTIWSSHDVHERLLLWTGSADIAYGISVCRTHRQGGFSARQVTQISAFMPILMATLKKHAAIAWSLPRFPAVLNSLPTIEACLAESPVRIPRREFQVCARLIYGMTTTGIALDLDIGEGSVMTYRKRVYDRLHIASQRELLLWYVTIWNTMFERATRAIN